MKIYGLKDSSVLQSSFGIKYLRHEDIISEVDPSQVVNSHVNK